MMQLLSWCDPISYLRRCLVFLKKIELFFSKRCYDTSHAQSIRQNQDRREEGRVVITEQNFLLFQCMFAVFLANFSIRGRIPLLLFHQSLSRSQARSTRRDRFRPLVL